MEDNNLNSNETPETISTSEDNSYHTEYSYNNQPTAPQYESASTAAFVLGIVSVAASICCCGGGLISIVCGIIGLVLGIPQMKKNPDDTRAKSGVILSAIGLALYVCLISISIVLSLTGVLSEVIYGINFI